MFRTIMAANRAEVAARILKTCKKMNIRCIVIATDADKDLQFLGAFDQVLELGDRREYLNREKILQLAKENQVSAIHPGWGFLSEDSTFASMAETAGIYFIGPTAGSMRMMSDKAKAREIMTELGLTPIPGVEGTLKDVAHAQEMAEVVGLPVLLKAVAGGGGRGMRRVFKAEDLEGLYQEASAEALSAFGNGIMYMEKLIIGGRHIEFQVLCDGKEAWVFAERECSIQRRHQKLIEETPSVMVTPIQRKALQKKIAEVCVAIGYRGAGTVEMLGDRDGNLYFMEMNTRLQVEHTITEEVTGIDLAEQQIRIAANEKINPQTIHCGHSIQCRINAESVADDFRPTPGLITKLVWPEGEGIRIDTHLKEGDRVSPHYDSMIAKVIVSAPNRKQAIAKMLEVLAGTVVEGVPTTIALHQKVLATEAFQSGNYDTKFLEDNLDILL